MNDGWYKIKLITIVVIFILVVAAGFGVYMYATRVSDAVSRRMMVNNNLVNNELAGTAQEPNVALKEQYTNPLDENTQYRNPFDNNEYHNPFDEATQ